MAAPRQDKLRKDTDTPLYPDSQPGCPPCNSDEPQTRARHQLFLARSGIDALKTHLWLNYAVHLPQQRREASISGICAWVAGEMDVWSGYVHPETGATLPWWEARTKAHAMPTKPDTAHPDARWKRSADLVRLPSEQIATMLEAALSQHAHDPWARGHILLMELGLHLEGREAAAAQDCRRFAAQWPQDREHWEREALWWAEGAPLKPGILDRQPGEEG